LADFQAAIQAEGKALADAAQALRQRIADGANTLAEEKLTDLQKEYEDATIKIRRFQDDKNREGQKMQAEGLRVIESKLQPVFDAILEENDYDVILNHAPGIVVMINKRVDITQKVIAKLNSGGTGSDG
jgi:Skp family chaperone for outer membrane proteins